MPTRHVVNHKRENKEEKCLFLNILRDKSMTQPLGVPKICHRNILQIVRLQMK